MPSVLSKEYQNQTKKEFIEDSDSKLRLKLFKSIIKNTPEHINVRDNEGNTPLMKLCMNFPHEYLNIDYLLMNGACPNIPNNEGNIPYLELKHQGYEKSCDLLLKYGSKERKISDFSSSSSNKVKCSIDDIDSKLNDITKVLKDVLEGINY